MPCAPTSSVLQLGHSEEDHVRKETGGAAATWQRCLTPRRPLALPLGQDRHEHGHGQPFHPTDQIKALGTILLVTERRELVGDVLLASPNRQGKHFTLTHLCSVLSRYIWLYNLQKVRSKWSCCWQEAPGSLRWPI